MPSTTCCTKLALLRRRLDSSIVTSIVSQNSWCAQQKCALKLSQVFLISGWRFQSVMSFLKRRVLFKMTLALTIICCRVSGCDLNLVKST
jgi:hypothetical protein